MTTIEGFIHGMPEGYEHGCRGVACANHGTDMPTCAEAWMRFQGDYSYRKRVQAGWSFDQIVEADAADRAADAERVAAAKQAERNAARVAAQKPAAVRKTRWERMTRGVLHAPSSGVVEAGEWVHGTVEGYWRGGCYVDADCPSNPTCAEANLAAQGPRVAPKERKERSTSGPQHGTIYSWQMGCRRVEDCPEHADGRTSCVEANREYNRAYSAKRRAEGLAGVTHGREYAYKLGCHTNDECPGGPDGVTCHDAQRAAELRRRRTNGVPARSELVPAEPVREHVRALQAQGMGVQRIALTAGVSFTGVRYLVYGREDYLPDGSKGPRHGAFAASITAEKAEKLLAVEYTPVWTTSKAEHGTRNGYKRFGCRGDDCPSKQAGGQSCSEASSDYQRAQRQRRAGNA